MQRQTRSLNLKDLKTVELWLTTTVQPGTACKAPTQIQSTMSEAQTNVMIVDDDPELCSSVQSYLTSEGFKVAAVNTVLEAREAMEVQEPDLFLLDLLLPGTSGKVFCREIVESTRAGVIVVSVLDSDEERITLLEMGADDYLVKPFNPRELLARIRAYLRRASGLAAPSVRRFGVWSLTNGERRLVHRGGTVITLTPSEARVMRLFADNPDLVFDRSEILAVSRMRQIGAGNDRSVDNLIKRLRRKIEVNPSNPELIETVWGRGYVFRAADAGE